MLNKNAAFFKKLSIPNFSKFLVFLFMILFIVYGDNLLCPPPPQVSQ